MHKLIRNLKRIRRNFYGLRIYIPWLKEMHILEEMVGPLGYWDELQSYQLNTLKSFGLKPEHKLLDIGCGPLQGGIAFIKYLNDNCYYGVDIDEKRLIAGLNQIKKFNLEEKQPKVLLSNTFGRAELKGLKFDFIWASQILYYFDEDKMKEVMSWLSIALKEDGKFLADIIGPEHYEFRSPEHKWILHTIEDLKNLAKSFNLKV